MQVALPAAIAEGAGGARSLPVSLPPGATVAALLRVLGAAYPRLGRRLCEDTGALRRHVNVYVDAEDIRGTGGTETALSDGSAVDIVPSVAGG